MPDGRISGSNVISRQPPFSSAERPVDHQCPDIDAATVRRPHLRGIVGRVARLGDGDDQAPAQRVAGQARDDVVEQEVRRPRAERGLVDRLEGRFRLERPAHEPGLAGVVDEAEGIDAVVGLVGEARRQRRVVLPLHEGAGLRMLRHVGVDAGRVGLAGPGVRRRGALEIEEGLRRRHREYRRIVQRHAPLLAVRLGEAERQRAEDKPAVGRIGLAAAGREAADHRTVGLGEDPGPRQQRAGAVAEKRSFDAQALGMGAAEAGMPAVMGFQGVDDGGGSKPVRRQPSGGHGEGRTQEREGRRRSREGARQWAGWGASRSDLRDLEKGAPGGGGGRGRRPARRREPWGEFSPGEKPVLKTPGGGGGRGAPPGAQA